MSRDDDAERSVAAGCIAVVVDPLTFSTTVAFAVEQGIEDARR